MNVGCPNCSTVYRVDPAKVPEQGVRARCAVCAAVFPVSREPATTPVVPVAELVRAPEPPAPVPAAPLASPPPVERPAATAPAMSAPAAVVAAPAMPRPTSPAAMPAAPQRWVMPPVVAPSPRAVQPAPPAMPGSRPPVMPRPAAPVVATPPASRAPAAPTAATARPINPFLASDPSQKARRLARALVSDMVVYHPAKRREALAAGTLKEAFEEEIAKSWEEYVEQVGRELADSTTHFTDALNEILADGRAIF